MRTRERPVDGAQEHCGTTTQESTRDASVAGATLLLDPYLHAGCLPAASHVFTCVCITCV